jgi:hypothetical protein
LPARRSNIASVHLLAFSAAIVQLGVRRQPGASRGIRLDVKRVNAALAMVGGLLIGLLVLSTPGAGGGLRGLEEPRFVGLTSRPPNVFTSTLPIHYQPFIDQWLKSGTRVVRFSITNNIHRRILLYPYVAFFENTNAVQQRYGTVLLNSPSQYGISLAPGQAVRVEVPILPAQGPGIVRFGYLPDYAHLISRSTEELREFIHHRKRPDYHTEWVFSGKVEP